uniref:ParA family protein n=1 Tax=Lentilactobacillus hilgardii TaxID=1588 RepID=UPI00403F3710
MMVLTGLALARQNKKTLLIDFDPQANATDIYFKTAVNLGNDELKFKQTLLTAIQDENLESSILHLDDNIDFIPSSADFSLYPRVMEKKFKDNYLDRVTYFSKLMTKINEEYDYVLFDLPPTISLKIILLYRKQVKNQKVLFQS